MARRGILSITFVDVSSEEGPTYLFSTNPTRFTRTIYADQQLLGNLFFVSSSVDEVKIANSRVLIHEVSGGDRGIDGYILVELTKNADTKEIRKLISEIESIPRSPEEAARILRAIL